MPPVSPSRIFLPARSFISIKKERALALGYPLSTSGDCTMPINDWPEHERPRERLLAHGAAALSDAELLAIFLRVGIRGKSAVDLARDLMGHFGGLTRLF